MIYEPFDGANQNRLLNSELNTNQTIEMFIVKVS
jgi:hypothetical protein